MGTDQSIVITAIGGMSALGSSWLKSCAAIDAAIAAFSESPLMDCTPADANWEDGLPVFVAQIPTIDAYITGVDRFVKLGISPLLDMLQQAAINRQALAQTGLLLSLPERDEALNTLGLDDLLEALCDRTGLTSLKFTDAYWSGRCGLFANIRRACDYLNSGQIKQCIVGGIDSYLLKERLKFLDTQWRLKSTRNRDGFIPGEAAVFLMLETASHALARGAKPLLCLGPQAEAEEVEHFYSSNNSSAIALGRVLQNVIKQRPALSEIRTIVSDFNGESYYAHEWGLTKTRLGPLCQHSISLIHPADCYGDVGAATGGLLIALAAYQFAKQSNNCPPAILTTANDSGMRCALVVEPYQNIK